MNGLVYTFSDETESTPIYWLGIVLAAVAVTTIPLLTLTLPSIPPVQEEMTIAITLDDSFLNPVAFDEAPAPAKPAAKLPPEPLPEEKVAVAPQPPPPAPMKIEPPPPPEPPATVVQLPPSAPKVKPPEQPKEGTGKAEPKPLHDRDLQPLIPTDVAFDESSKITKEAPKGAYLSDRNSTAADRGPKNLKIGDPFMEGETNLIKYQGRRGKGNLPPLNSDPNSGSVKKEGAPLSGDGGGPLAPDLSKSVKSAEPPIEKNEPLNNDPVPIAAKSAQPERKAPEASVPIKPNARPLPKPETANTEPEVNDVGVKLPSPRPKQFPSEPLQIVTNFELSNSKNKKSAEAVEPYKVEPATPAVPAQPNREAISKALDAQAELARFEAQLNGVNSAAAGDGSTGSTGPKLRKGEQGHEGNGTIRPGDDGAVSDVTSVNLESSAAELGDPRFAKRFDAKTAYIKAFARRIDAKWKADIHAKLRVRLIPGMVSIRIVLRKDGKLLEASEAYRNRGVPDEYVATAKHAVEEAADPTADPFPAALSGRETIEYTFNFLYQ